MRLILIAYFYPPIENVAAQRWKRFVQYLESMGHEITIITGPWKNNHLNNHKMIILSDPFSGDAQRLGNLHSKARFSDLKKFIPFSFLLIDGKWLWSLQVFCVLVFRLLTQKKQSVIVTASPFSALPAVAAACKITHASYGVDFRDSWSTQTLPFTFRSKKALTYFSKIERWVVRGAKLILTVSDPILLFLKSINPNAVALSLPNAYEGTLSWDERSFNKISELKKIIFYSGTISNYHGMDKFLEAIDEAVSIPFFFMGTDFVGALNERKKQKKIEHSESKTQEESDAIEMSSAVLLLTLDSEASDFTTGKLMSYIKAGRPILYFGPINSPAAKIISQYRIGWPVDCRRPETLTPILAKISNHFRENIPFDFSPDLEGLKKYSLQSCGTRLNSSLSEAFSLENISFT